LLNIRWNDEEETKGSTEAKSVHILFTQTTNTFRSSYFAWYELWRILSKKWGKASKVERYIQRIFEVEMDTLGIDIQHLAIEDENK